MNRLPYPLVDGFLAGLGWVLSVASISISCGITLNWETLPELLESDMIRKWAPNLADALVLLSVTKLRSHYLVLPASVVLALGLCRAVLFFLGISAEEARAAGILFVGMPAGASWPPVDVEVLTHVDWGVVASQLPGIPGLDPAAPPLVAWLGPIADEVERTAPAHVSFEPELTFLVDCNWKTYVDNYQEGYHIPPLHPGLNRDLDWKRYRVVNFAGGSRHEAPPKGRSVHPGTFGWRFPNFTFNSYPDGLSFMRMEPAGHTQTRLVYHYYRPDSVSVEAFEATVTYGTLVSEEDQWIVPLIQQNLDAGVYDREPLSPRHESGVFHFHKTVRAALDSAPPDGSHDPSASPGTTVSPELSITSG